MTAQERGYVDAEYLRVVAGIFAPLKQRSYACMRIEPGHSLLDVGCGTGADTVAMAEMAGPLGRIEGVDTDAAMLSAADARARGQGVAGRVRHRQADANHLPFRDGEFDACRSERVFQHLPDPARPLSEMARVTRAGGRVVVMDTDWGSASVDTPEPDVERRLLRYLTERMHHNGYAGRQLYRLLKAQGLVDVAFETFPVALTGAALVRQILTADRLEREALAAGAVSDEELGRWREGLRQMDATGGCYFSATVVLAHGTRD